mgnify:CR=1 FL=1
MVFCLPPAQVEKEEREWCAGLHAAVFYPWVEQLARQLDQDAPAPPPTAWCVTRLVREQRPDGVACLQKRTLRHGGSRPIACSTDCRCDAQCCLQCAGRGAGGRAAEQGGAVRAARGVGVATGPAGPGAPPGARGGINCMCARAPRPGFSCMRGPCATGPACTPHTQLQASFASSTYPKPATPRAQVLRVRSCVAQSHASKVLRSGDMLLAMSGRPVTCFQDVERLISEASAAAATAGAAGTGPAAEPTEAGTVDEPASKRPRVDAASEGAAAAAAPADGSGRPTMHLTIYRSGAVQDVEVVLGQEDGMGTGRLVHWCGAQLQAPHRGVRELGFLPEGAAGVYISRWHHGSPAHRYGLYALHWIQQVRGGGGAAVGRRWHREEVQCSCSYCRQHRRAAILKQRTSLCIVPVHCSFLRWFTLTCAPNTQVNGVDTPDLDSFLAAVANIGDGQFVRLKV